MSVGLEHYLVVSTLLFCLGLLGVLVRRNLLVIYLSLELMLNAANVALVSFAYHFARMEAQLIALFVMALAAAEVAVGLAIIVTVFRTKETVNVDDLNILKW